MKTQLGFLSVLVLALASCNKDNKKAVPEEAQTRAPSGTSSLVEHLAAPKQPEPSPSRSADSTTVRARGISASDESWEKLSGQEMLEQFQAKGIAGVPRNVAEQILAGASNQTTADDQVNFILTQTEAWRQVNAFMQQSAAIPENQKRHLVDQLSEKHAGSWPAIAAEIGEQVAAGNEVMSLRLNGLPGLSVEDSDDLIIEVIGRYAPDYKRVLHAVRQIPGN